MYMPKASIGAANSLILMRCIPRNILYSQEPQNNTIQLQDPREEITVTLQGSQCGLGLHCACG